MRVFPFLPLPFLLCLRLSLASPTALETTLVSARGEYLPDPDLPQGQLYVKSRYIFASLSIDFSPCLSFNSRMALKGMLLLEDILFKLKEEPEFVVNCHRIIDGVKEMSLWAKEYDPLPGLEANGFRSYILIVSKFAALVSQSVNDKKFKSLNENFLIVSRLHYKVLEHLLLVRKDTKCHESDLNANIVSRTDIMFSPSSESAAKIIAEGNDLREELNALHTIGSFWLKGIWKLHMKTIRTLVSFMSTKSVRSLFNSKKQVEAFTECVQRTNFKHPTSTWALTDLPIYKNVFVNLVYLFAPSSAKTVYIPRDNDWCLTETRVLKSAAEKRQLLLNQKETVRCRLLRNTRRRDNGQSLIIHCHGGALMVQSPDSHEIYLRDWAAKLPGVPILSVDYTLMAKYPTVLQEVLDVYLWVTSGSLEVKALLGFRPTKVVFCGDSAGGYILSSLLGPLNEINLADNLMMPKALVLIYPEIRNTSLLSPSRCLSPYETLLPLGIFLLVVGLYGDPEGASPAKETHEENNNMKETGFGTAAELSPESWFNCSGNALKTSLEYRESLVSHPFCSLLNYEHFEDFKEIPIHLIASQFDPLLDDAVQLAKLWKGPLTFDVVEGIPHGFLNFKHMSKSGDRAIEMCLNRLMQAL